METTKKQMIEALVKTNPLYASKNGFNKRSIEEITKLYQEAKQLGLIKEAN